MLAHPTHQATNQECTPSLVRSSKVPPAARKKRDYIIACLACMCFFPLQITSDTVRYGGTCFQQGSATIVAFPETNDKKTNTYPVPPCMANVFNKRGSWVETPRPTSKSILLLPHERLGQHSQVYAVDCEMACYHLSTMSPTQPNTVSNRRWKGTEPTSASSTMSLTLFIKLFRRHFRHSRPLKPRLAWLAKQWHHHKIQMCCKGRHEDTCT